MKRLDLNIRNMIENESSKKLPGLCCEMFHPLVKPNKQHYSSDQVERSQLLARTLEIMNIAKSVRTRANLRELRNYFEAE